MKGLDAEHYLLSVSLDRKRVPSFDEYPFCLPVVRRLRTLTLHPAVTFIIGENGSGKSTLLEAIAVAWGFNPEGGSRNFQFQTRASHSNLHEYLRLVRGVHRPRGGFFLRAESFFNLATKIEELDRIECQEAPIITRYGGRSLHEQSHGESFLSLLTNRFHGGGLYILDEPEAALSPARQMAALARIHQLAREKAQFIIATHSPILMAYPNAGILQLTGEGMSAVEYTQTDYYRLTKAFLDRHEAMLEELMDSPDEAGS